MTTPLIAHVIYRLGTGGLENGLINLINHFPAERYRHAIVCLTCATAFKERLRRKVPIYEMGKREGQDLRLHWRVWQLFKKLKPTIVHTRNLAALECQLLAFFAGVPVRIHGEHGWDVFDPEGKNLKYQALRRAFRPLIHHYIPLSKQLERYLIERVKVAPAKITRITNGVDTSRFYPPANGREPIPDCPFTGPGLVLIGTVGRMHGVKDQPTLVRAFIALVQNSPELKAKARLILIGDGPLKAECQELLARVGLAELAWLPGEREDIPEILRGLDVFVLPSQAEGISNTILEAMATGLPVVATAVGGNLELVEDGHTGILVPKGDFVRLAQALASYIQEEGKRRTHGWCGLKRVRENYSLAQMVQRYLEVYEKFKS